MSNHPNIGMSLDDFLKETNNLENANKIAKERVEKFLSQHGKEVAMSDPNIKLASLAEIKAMKEKGSLFHDPKAPEGGENLGPEFWAKAHLVEPKSLQPVTLESKLK